MTGLALHADPTCVPFFRHDGRQVGAAWGVGRTWSGRHAEEDIPEKAPVSTKNSF